VSAGKHVPQYFHNYSGIGMGMNDGGSQYNGAVGQAPDMVMNGSQLNQFNVTQGTQGFYRQKYE